MTQRAKDLIIANTPGLIEELRQIRHLVQSNDKAMDRLNAVIEQLDSVMICVPYDTCDECPGRGSCNGGE